MFINNSRPRRRLVFCVFFLLFLVCLGRFFFIQCFRNKYLASLARKQQQLFIHLNPQRGTIFDRNLKPLAIDLAAESLYAVPQEIKGKKKDIIKKLLPILKEELPTWAGQSYLEKKLNSDKQFVWLARKLSDDVVGKIKTLNLAGLYFIQEARRVYPNSYLASHLIGFAGLDNNGLEGIELYYDRYLAGTSGWGVLLRDGHQEKLGLWKRLVLPNNGYNLILTIDEVIQFIVERDLDRIVERFHPRGASIVVMQPSSGEILALANRPTFDLNQVSKTDNTIRRNRAIIDLIEPGSVFKIVAAAAALEEGIVSEEDRIFCEDGAYRIANHTIHDHRPHGWLNFKEIIEESSNIGVAKVAGNLGKDSLYKYIRRFGFGDKLGIDLPGEISGILNQPNQWSPVSTATISFGQGIGVTVLQLATAISAIANQGRLMKPYIVKEIQDEFGATVKQFSPELLSVVISPRSALRVKEILVGVVEKGTGRLAQIDGLRVAGKTGTAQKVEPNGGYSHQKYVASFIGFAPADNPEISVVLVVDEPQPYYFGGVVCAPAFKNICDNVLRYLQTQKVLMNGVKDETERVD